MFFVYEIQETAPGVYASLTYHEDSWTYQQAESVFYGKCQYAAISTIPTHTVIFADADGSVYQVKTWKREVTSE